MQAALGRVIIYTKKMAEMVAFYTSHFGFAEHCLEGDRIVELRPAHGGATLLLHPAAKGQKQGQSLMKLVFDVEDVPGFCEAAAAKGLHFGPVHQADGYCFANTKDPSGNSVSVSSRNFRGQPD